MRNKMTEKTFTELQNALEAEFRFQYPEDNLGMTYARMLGAVLAYTSKDTLATILENKKQECGRCGRDVLPSEHGSFGCGS